MDKYKIDSHKLIYHPERISAWLRGKRIYPIYMEVSPAGSCNHRCIYCALDFMGYANRFLDTVVFKKRLKEMGRLGVKSIMYAGEGEPFLHKDICQIIASTKQNGIDAAVTSNAVLFDREIAAQSLPYLSWIKVSINAARPATYAKIHRANAEDFNRVIKNMAYAAQLRRKKGYTAALGMQIVLLPDNYQEVIALAKIAKAIGMDYLVVKPYSQHPLSKTNIFKGIKYCRYLDLSDKLKKINSPKFNVVFRGHSMQKWDTVQRNYQHCLALSFWAYLDAGGNLWACSIYLKNSKFCLGNIYKNSFKEIWESKKHDSLNRWAASRLQTQKCRVNCRMDEVNRYLWDLTHPVKHVNFI